MASSPHFTRETCRLRAQSKTSCICLCSGLPHEWAFHTNLRSQLEGACPDTPTTFIENKRMAQSCFTSSINAHFRLVSPIMQSFSGSNSFQAACQVLSWEVENLGRKGRECTPMPPTFQSFGARLLLSPSFIY